jgi:acetyl esterase/lipase
MIRWFLPALALGFVAVGSLTVARSPDWSPWRLAVLAGEYGHWLALPALSVGVLAWISRGGAMGLAIGTMILAGSATLLLLRPVFSAVRIGRELPAQLERAFGRVAVARAPFAVSGLFGGAPRVVPVQAVSYGEGLALDYYRAERTDGRLPPCVIVVHGGGWDSGDRGQFAEFNHWLAGRGFAVAAISYRLAPKFRWPAPRDDLLAAIAALKARATDLRFDASQLVLFGRSAGGQIAQAVGYTAGEPAIRGVIAIYTPSDLIFGYEHAREDDVLKSPHLMRQYLGGTPESARANYESASALRHVTRAAPPTLLLHGELDSLVWHRHSVRLDARLAENAVSHAFVSLPWATHAFEYNLHGPGGQLTTYAVEWFLGAVTR